MSEFLSLMKILLFWSCKKYILFTIHGFVYFPPLSAKRSINLCSLTSEGRVSKSLCNLVVKNLYLFSWLIPDCFSELHLACWASAPPGKLWKHVIGVGRWEILGIKEKQKSWERGTSGTSAIMGWLTHHGHFKEPCPQVNKWTTENKLRISLALLKTEIQTKPYCLDERKCRNSDHTLC